MINIQLFADLFSMIWPEINIFIKYFICNFSTICAAPVLNLIKVFDIFLFFFYLKVVGGMTWCITTCNFDVDVDLLFQENSTIGQKM